MDDARLLMDSSSHLPDARFLASLQKSCGDNDPIWGWAAVRADCYDGRARPVAPEFRHSRSSWKVQALPPIHESFSLLREDGRLEGPLRAGVERVRGRRWQCSGMVVQIGRAVGGR